MADGPNISIDNTMGASLIGVICAGILYGVSCVQTWYYFNRYTKDVWYIKSLVGAVWVFDSVHQGLISHTVYYYVITNYGKPTILNNMVWSILLEVLFNAFIGLLVQGFLALRVWRLSNQKILLIGLIAGLILAEFGWFGWFYPFFIVLTTAATSSMLNHLCDTIHETDNMGTIIGAKGRLVRLLYLDAADEDDHHQGLSMTVNVLAAAADVLIAASLCYFLQCSRTGFKKSDTMISKLILFTVSTGLLTSICAIASLVSILLWGNTLIYVAFYFSLGRLYSNSVLATLNARQAIRELGEDSENLSFSLQPTFSKPGPTGRFNSNRTTNISIKIDTTHQYTCDPSRQEPDVSSATTDNSY